MTSITPEFIQQCKDNFYANPVNQIGRNAIVNVGSSNALIDASKLSSITHNFVNTIKPHGIKATDQGSSGRCWMFAGLNMYRYMVIKVLGVRDFEFSETYLFFWDKYERANYILQWHIDHPDAKITDRITGEINGLISSDGGHWFWFANLVKKYGLVPKSSMDETFQSGRSSDMNDVLERKLLIAMANINKPNIKATTLRNIYNILCMYLGNPPEKFDYYFTTGAEDEQSTKVLPVMTPMKFASLFIETIDPSEFVVLINSPDRKFYTNYTCKQINNMVDGANIIALNVPIDQIRECAVKQINGGLPVMTGVKMAGFDYWLQSLDESLFATEQLFGEDAVKDKATKMKYKITAAEHAMTIVGYNRTKNLITRWQIENSWGYRDHTTPGEDGFLSASNSWFDDNVIEIVVHRSFLTRKVSAHIDSTPVEIDLWEMSTIDSTGLRNKFN